MGFPILFTGEDFSAVFDDAHELHKYEVIVRTRHVDRPVNTPHLWFVGHIKRGGELGKRRKKVELYIKAKGLVYEVRDSGCLCRESYWSH